MQITGAVKIAPVTNHFASVMLRCNSNMYLLTQNIGHHSTGSVSRQGDVVLCTEVGDVY